MTTLLNIRAIQIKRSLHDAGIRILLLIGFLAFLIYASFVSWQNPKDAILLTLILFGVPVLIQFYRGDKLFVYSHIQNPYLQVYFEYVALTFPFAITSLLTKYWFFYPVLLVLLAFVPLVKFTLKQRTYFRKISKLIPAANFEWISGFRKHFIYLIPLYVLAIGFSWFIILPFLLLWFITLTISSFYFECEPLQILREGNPDARRFLKRKLVQNIKQMLILSSPVFIVNTVVNPDYWLINSLWILVQLILLCFAICYKYAVYEPNTQLRSSSIISLLVSVSSLVPYLAPVPLIMVLVYYPKAKRNLINYLND